MTWYDKNWRYRAAVALDNSAGSGTTIDGQVTIPIHWDHFWNTIESNAHSIRFTQSDGTTGCNYNRQTWTYADRSGVFQIDGVQAIANESTVIYMYWGNSSAGDGDGSPTISSAKTGEIEVSAPLPPIVSLQLDPYGSSNPKPRFQKTVDEVVDVWIDCRPSLARRSSSNAGSSRYEEIHSVNVDVQTNGSSQASMFDETKTRVIDPGWVRIRVKAGSSGTAYTIIPKITTSLGRVIEARAIMKVVNTNEA